MNEYELWHGREYLRGLEVREGDLYYILATQMASEYGNIQMNHAKRIWDLNGLKMD